MEIPKPMIVACRCGWQGEQRDLITFKDSDIKQCPACARPFEKLKMPAPDRS
jgi:hypothetical protein